MAQNASGLFADVELAARIERAERTLIEEGALAAARRDAHERVLVLPVGGGLAVWAGTGSPLNKVVGLGFGGRVEDRELDAVEAELAERDTPVQFEISTLADPALVERLTRRGYVLRGFENVLGLRLAAGREAPLAKGVAIHDVGPREFEAWLDVVVDGFATPDTQGVASHEEFTRSAVERAMRDLTSASGFVCSLASLDGAPAGGASLRRSEGLAQLCGAATLPGFRRRGVQASLLSARLASAAGAGCDLAVVTTQPGSKSQENVQRLGFELLYARAVLVRPA